jgi:hypothetical protein
MMGKGFEPMRLGKAALLVSVLVLSGSPAFAWEEFMYADLGIAKEFPSAPTIENGTYHTDVAGAGDVPAIIYSVKEDHIIYRMTVADMRAPEYVERSASIQAECIERAENEGTVLAKMPQRVEDGTDYRVYGHMTSVELFDDGGRKQTNCFFTKGRQIVIEAIILPEFGRPNSPNAIRFSASLRFRIDGTEYIPPENQ